MISDASLHYGFLEFHYPCKNVERMTKRFEVPKLPLHLERQH